MGELHKTVRREIKTHIFSERQLNTAISHQKINMTPDMHASTMKYYASTAFCFKFHLAATTRYGKLNSSEVAAFIVEMTFWTSSFIANNTASFKECIAFN